MTTFSAIVADDETLGRKALELMLRADPEVRVVATCSDGRTAVEQIRERNPDLAFVDVEMPQLDGFAVLEALEPKERPHVVFVSRNPLHAVRAFDILAVDYLLKPFSERRFAVALTRVKNVIRNQRAGYLTQQVERLLQYARELDDSSAIIAPRPSSGDGDPLVLRSGGALHFVRSSDVVWIEAQGDSVKVQTSGTSQIVRETLQSLEQRLDPSRFLRIHRSFIVNLDHVHRVETALYGDYSVYMSDGSKLRLSRSYRAKLTSLVNRAAV